MIVFWVELTDVSNLRPKPLLVKGYFSIFAAQYQLFINNKAISVEGLTVEFNAISCFRTSYKRYK